MWLGLPELVGRVVWVWNLDLASGLGLCFCFLELGRTVLESRFALGW